MAICKCVRILWHDDKQVASQQIAFSYTSVDLPCGVQRPAAERLWRFQVPWPVPCFLLLKTLGQDASSGTLPTVEQLRGAKNRTGENEKRWRCWRSRSKISVCADRHLECKQASKREDFQPKLWSFSHSFKI